MLRSTLIDHIRRQTANHCVTIDIEDMAESAASYTQNEDSVASDDVAKCIDMVMPALQKDYADILRRVDLHEQPRDKVAEALNMSVGNVRVKLHRARRALKTALESYCNERCWENGCECTCLRCGM